MAKFGEADDSEISLKELLETWDEEKVAQIKNRGSENQEAFEKSDKENASGWKPEMAAEEEEQEEAGDGNKKRMGRRSRRKIIIEVESEDSTLLV
ncbi:hypothetical protein BHYA_0240g00190 [Botrytis hyacinthi]|uniref:Uncharacterized protein n=1 Tax=Botrytis hyacinthi TaxID=278943 RepID=A0A4Z1GEL2_9HELO|nr:hypothetical protein BHYA_0240g00190 [Botrytis hyacinthi]